MRVCFWTTSFQADNQALACYLARRSPSDVCVAMPEPERYRAEPVNQVLPFSGRLLDRGGKRVLDDIRAFGPDIVIVDNHLPPERLADKLFVLWHGLGWRVDDLRAMQRQIKALVGDSRSANDSFRWQAFGPPDARYRVEHSEFAPENVVELGSAYSDLLLPSSQVQRQFERRNFQRYYQIDLERPTLLLGLTWHHGPALAHFGAAPGDAVGNAEWSAELSRLDQLCAFARDRNLNLLLRMHDRHRYDPAYVAALEKVALGRPQIQLKFKSDHPDSLVDLLVSDILVSNYSSLLNAFYYTLRPTIHIDPRVAAERPQYYRKLKLGRVWKRRLADPAEQWKFSPTDIGGLCATSFDQLLAQVEMALTRPDCCQELARAFMRRHVTEPNGATSERIAAYLSQWLQEA